MDETVNAALSVTFLGGALIATAAAHHSFLHGFHDFHTAPLSQTTRRILNYGGYALFVGAAVTFAGCALGLTA